MNNSIQENTEGSYLSYYIVAALSLFIIFIYIVLFSLGGHGATVGTSEYKGVESTYMYIFLGIVFTFLAIVASTYYLKSFQAFKSILMRLQSQIYILIYIIFLIVFFSLTSRTFIDNYAKFITPILLAIGIGMMFRAKSVVIKNIDTSLEFEKIKSMINILSFFVIMMIFNIVDPGGYIKKNYGSTLLYGILISVFALAYFIVIFFVPNIENINIAKVTTTGEMNKSIAIGAILFIIFVLSLYIGFNKFDKTDTKRYLILIFLIFIASILWGAFFISNYFKYQHIEGEGFKPTAKTVEKTLTLVDILKKLFFLSVAIIVIIWLFNTKKTGKGWSLDMSSPFSLIRFILNAVIIILVLTIVYRTVNVRVPNEAVDAKKNTFIQLISSILFYIPCYFSDITDYLMKNIDLKADKDSLGSLLLVILLIAAIYAYMNYFPPIDLWLMKQGGTILVNNPVYSAQERVLATYDELNNIPSTATTPVPKYNYGLSFWVFLDVSPTSTDKYISLLNYGNKPSVQYNSTQNNILITMQNEDKAETTVTIDNVQLQKWNNLIINYLGGTLDIFYNGQLIKSIPGVIPYMKYDSLTIGSSNSRVGIPGGLAKVIYFPQPLTSSNIYYLYNIIKPDVSLSNTTIVTNTNTSNKK